MFILSFYMNYCNSYLGSGANQLNKPTHLDLLLGWDISRDSRPTRWFLMAALLLEVMNSHDDVIKWKYFPRYWPFVCGIHRSPVNSPHKGQWRLVLMFSLICARINGWVNDGEAGDLRRHPAHYGVTVMAMLLTKMQNKFSLSSTRSDFYQLFFFLLKTNLEVKH